MNIIDTEKRMERIELALSDYKKISLDEMNESNLMSRYDQKYVFAFLKLADFIVALKME